MQVYIFRSVKVTDVFGFTEDEAGRNLPPEFSPWSRQGEAQAIRAGVDRGPERTAMQSGAPFASKVMPSPGRASRSHGHGQSRCRDARYRTLLVADRRWSRRCRSV
jgi:hypothetical protein